MLFNSYEFIFFFLPVVVAGFWVLARVAGRDIAVSWLVCGSFVFYLYAGWKGVAILTPSIIVDYLIASILLRLPEARSQLRTGLFITGIVANVTFLAYFKYKNFFLDTANSLFGSHFHLTTIMLPMGISFLTFQKISFLADVRAGSVDRVRFLDYLLFTTFFPRSIAGPIVRYQHVVPQLETILTGELTTHLSVGITLFSFGFFKKAFVADQLAPWVSPVFDLGPVMVQDPGLPTLFTSWVAVLAYTFQLYFDFSGYSDMALGVARMCGVRLPMNFNSPFKASSIVDFWARWHITLTRFLTANIYTPLVLAITRARLARGKRVLTRSSTRASAVMAIVVVPTLTTMAISGIWHGAGWQFVVWGGLHGIYLTLNQTWRLVRPRFWPDSVSYLRVMRPAGVVLTFAAVVVALVFFRARSVSEALSILYAMLGGHGMVPDDLRVLRQLGVTVPSSLMHSFLPTMPWIWFAVLFFWVLGLPNSLEILRRYQPALDFPVGGKQGHLTQPSPVARGGLGKLRAVFEVGRNGLALGPLMSSLAALLCLLGILMLNRGETFIYWNF